MSYKVGTILNIKGIQGTVIGYITYANQKDGDKEWTEYRLSTSKGECWLSCDDVYKEYSVSWPANTVNGRIGPEWHKVDEGTQVVKASAGDVDVDYGERATFVEYEDASEDNILSVEMWSDGTEYSKGYYVEKTDIYVTGYKKPKEFSNFMSSIIMIIVCFAVVLLINVIGQMDNSSNSSNKSISEYVKNSYLYTYETSITGQEKQKADVYEYYYTPEKVDYVARDFINRHETSITGQEKQKADDYEFYYTPITTDYVAQDIINGIEGYTQSVTQKDDQDDAEIAIVTDKEYCLVYHAEDDADHVYVQVSSRKYNYTSNNAPYRCSDSDLRWYRSHYYSSSYKSDSVTYKNTPSAYKMYDGDTIHNIGNGYFDSYSSSIRQRSINRRNSSSGGISSGK